MTVGTSVVYPPELPCPQQASIRSAERRIREPEGGVYEARAAQTDRLSYEDIAFPPFTDSQAERFQTFWDAETKRGGLWFSATWPRPEGRVPTARRFMAPPAWEFIPGGYWRVTATFEVRGVGELPINPGPPSGWNPFDMISAQALPVCVDLTEDYRLATRNTVLPDHWEGGVRGTQSRGGIAGQRWYLELEVVSIGDGSPSANQGMQIGMVDERATNVLSRPPPSDSSHIVNLSFPKAHYVLAYSRFDGVVYTDTPPPPASPGDFTTQMQPGDIFGFDWIVGTSITVRRNNAGAIVVPFTYTGQMFPYFSAGATTVDATNMGSTESCRIRTGRAQQSYRPAASNYWG